MRAAESMNTQKARLSRVVARLEKDLGVRLLERTTRSLSLTEAGREIFERAVGILGAVDTIVLVHGICGNPGIWAMNLPALAATGRSVAHASRAGRPERDPGRCGWERSTGRQSARSGGARADARRVGRCGHDQPTSGPRDDVARRLGVSPARTGGSTRCFGSSFTVVRLLSGAW